MTVVTGGRYILEATSLQVSSSRFSISWSSAIGIPRASSIRIVRALEVYRVTGHPISHLQLQFEEGRPANQRRVFVLRPGFPDDLLTRVLGTWQRVPYPGTGLTELRSEPR